MTVKKRRGFNEREASKTKMGRKGKERVDLGGRRRRGEKRRKVGKRRRKGGSLVVYGGKVHKPESGEVSLTVCVLPCLIEFATRISATQRGLAAG